MNRVNSKYDVAIIGAGIGGLVCGCYLAKAGMKVLIAEKNANPGGYCTSFKRKGFTFDSTVRGLVGCGEKGILNKIFKDLNVHRDINVKRVPVFDNIVTPDFNISIKCDFNETKIDLTEAFPKERKAINDFFRILATNNFYHLYSMLKGKNFQEVIDDFFTNPKLKSFWNIMRLDTGLAPFRTSALAGISLCRGYLLDGGYYPEGGMQSIPNALADIFKKNGGDIVFSKKVKKIEIKNNRLQGIFLDTDTFVQSEYIVSNCDATHTFTQLIDSEHITGGFLKQIKHMVPSPSVFIVYLGLNKRLDKKIKDCCSLWYFPGQPKPNDYDVLFRDKLNFSFKYFVCAFPSLHDRNMATKGGESIYLYVGAPFKDDEFWKRNRKRFTDNVVSRITSILPGIDTSIEVLETATPQTLFKYTLNREGSSRGWAALDDQMAFDLMPNDTLIDGLFLAGHWVTCPTGQGGVTMAAYSGHNAAKMILKRDRQKC